MWGKERRNSERISTAVRRNMAMREARDTSGAGPAMMAKAGALIGFLARSVCAAPVSSTSTAEPDSSVTTTATTTAAASTVADQNPGSSVILGGHFDDTAVIIGLALAGILLVGEPSDIISLSLHV